MNKIKINKKELNKIADEYKLNYLVLFGSRADRTAREDSDYDIAYSSKSDIDYGEEALLTEKLAKVLRIKKIDIVNMSHAGPLLMKEVSDKGILIAEFTPSSFDKFQIYSFMQYVEAKPLFKMREEYVRNV
jgi:predicted nucleotidyltransferase